MRWGGQLSRVLRVLRARWVNATRRRVSLGPGSQLKGRILHSGRGTVEIGDGARIGMGARPGNLIVAGAGRIVIGAGCKIDAAEIHTLDADATITIGDGCYLNRVEMAAAESITIGQRCEIGSAVIFDTDFHSVQRSPRGAVRTGPIVSGDDVWIASRTAILRGVTVGSRSVIGMGVVVSHDVDPDTVVRPSQPRRDGR